MSLQSTTARFVALGLFAAVCGAGGAVAAVTVLPPVRDALRGPAGPQGTTGPSGLNGPPGPAVDPDEIKRSVIADLSLSSCSDLGRSVSVVTGVAVSPFDAFGRPTLNVDQQTVCVLN